MSLQIRDISDNISKLNVTGLEIATLSGIPADCTNLLPILIPEPLGYVTDFTVEWNSQGGGGVQMMTVEYNLHYTFLYVSIGAGRTGLDYYGDMVYMAFAILDEILAHDNLGDTIDFLPQDTLEFGPVPDPAGNQYLGCRFTFHVKEFVN